MENVKELGSQEFHDYLSQGTVMISFYFVDLNLILTCYKDNRSFGISGMSLVKRSLDISGLY